MGDVPPSMTDYDDDGDDDRRLFPLSRIIESSLIKTAAVAGVVESFTFLLSQYHAHANSNLMFCSLEIPSSSSSSCALLFLLGDGRLEKEQFSKVINHKKA